MRKQREGCCGLVCSQRKSFYARQFRPLLEERLGDVPAKEKIPTLAGVDTEIRLTWSACCLIMLAINHCKMRRQHTNPLQELELLEQIRLSVELSCQIRKC